MFAQHMHARQIFLGYEALARALRTSRSLSLAEMAAFSGGGGFSGSGAPQAKYRAFFKKHPDLFAGWQMTAPVAVLYCSWGRNPLGYIRPVTQPHDPGIPGRDAPALRVSDRRQICPRRPAPLAAFRAIYLQSSGYEVNESQLGALREYAAGGGQIVLADKKIMLNGKPVQEMLARGKVSLWDWKEPAVLEESIARRERSGRRLCDLPSTVTTIGSRCTS